VERRKKRGGRCGRKGTMGAEKVPAADERERDKGRISMQEGWEMIS